MTYYVIATDRDGCELTRQGMMLHKQVFICETLHEAQTVTRMLKERGERFRSVQTSRHMPVFNSKVYTWSAIPASSWTRGQ